MVQLFIDAFILFYAPSWVAYHFIDVQLLRKFEQLRSKDRNPSCSTYHNWSTSWL